MNASHLDWFVCPECSASGLQLEPYDSDGDEVAEGRVLCSPCGAWYRIENGILDLLPPRLRRMELYEPFATKHRLRVDAGHVCQEDVSGVTEQVKFFKENAMDYEERIVKNPYYLSLDQSTFVDWMKRSLKPNDRVLDLGCGTGRQSIPFAQYGLMSCGIDISEEMLRLARRKVRSMNLEDRVELVVGDAQNPPVKEQMFNGCIFYGTLHHLPHPGHAIANAAMKIMAGGYFFSLDPHKSPVRFIFDWIMRIWKLYEEKANEEPLMSEEQLNQWLRDAGLQSTIKLSTYLPPHAFMFTPTTMNVRVLTATDAIFRRIPGMKSWAGVIISEGVKNR